VPQSLPAAVALPVIDVADARDADIARTQVNVAIVYMQQKRHDEALALFHTAMAMFEKVHDGKGHPDVAELQRHIAGVYLLQGRHDEALPLLRAALATLEKVHDKDHEEVSNLRHKIAAGCLQLGRYDEALALWHTVLATRVKAYAGKDDPGVAETQCNIATVYMMQGRYDAALKLYHTAMATLEKVHGKDHPDVVQLQRNIAECKKNAPAGRPAVTCKEGLIPPNTTVKVQGLQSRPQYPLVRPMVAAAP
jgi:tetratricopeptide (TPR) repeat protein